MWNVVFWVVTPRTVLSGYQRFRRAYVSGKRVARSPPSSCLHYTPTERHSGDGHSLTLPFFLNLVWSKVLTAGSMKKVILWTGRVAHKWEKRNAEFWLENLYASKRPIARRMWGILLKWIFGKLGSEIWTGFIQLSRERLVAGSAEHGYKLSGSMQCGKFLD